MSTSKSELEEEGSKFIAVRSSSDNVRAERQRQDSHAVAGVPTRDGTEHRWRILNLAL